MPRKVHDPHAAMTITSRKWGRLTKRMRRRVGTAQEKPHHLAVNGDQVIAQSKAAADLRTTVTTGKGPSGIRYTCTVQMDENGRSVLEQWVSSYGLSAGSLRRQWRTLTYAFVPKKAFERIPDASTPSRPLIRLL